MISAGNEASKTLIANAIAKRFYDTSCGRHRGFFVLLTLPRKPFARRYEQLPAEPGCGWI
jgi:hypothetical protein